MHSEMTINYCDLFRNKVTLVCSWLILIFILDVHATQQYLIKNTDTCAWGVVFIL